MPIKKENRKLYPENWKSKIAPAVIIQANNQCQQCGAPNHAMIQRNRRKERWRYAENYYGNGQWGDAIRVSLSACHIDQNPENCKRDNLIALCQKCHLRLDQEAHNITAAQTSRNQLIAAGQLSLF